MALQHGHTLDTSLPSWMAYTERHPVYGVPLIHFRQRDSNYRIVMVYLGIVNETGEIACARITDTGPGDHIFTFPMERFSPVPGFKPGIIPAQ